MSAPEGTIGYCAVIIPALDEYQGVFIVDNDEMRPQSVMTMLTAGMTGGHPIGTLQAAMVEGVITRNMGLTGAAALALHGLTKESYFVIIGGKEGNGYRTNMVPLRADNIPDARMEIEAMPAVIELKERLRTEMQKKKH